MTRHVRCSRSGRVQHAAGVLFGLRQHLVRRRHAAEVGEPDPHRSALAQQLPRPRSTVQLGGLCARVQLPGRQPHESRRQVCYLVMIHGPYFGRTPMEIHHIGNSFSYPCRREVILMRKWVH